MKIEYDSNNSGGNWWLKDEDWRALEAAGWSVKWYAGGAGKWHSPDSDGRWLGALAGGASKEFDSPADALREFERVTGQDVTDEGCNCCGPPHSFSWDGGYASGQDCAEVLYGEAPSYRDLLRRRRGEGGK